MNTGITSFTSRPAETAPAKAAVSVVKPGSHDSKTTEAFNTVSLPANSNAAVRISENGLEKQGPQASDASKKPTLQEVIELSEKLNQNVQRIQRDLNFSVDENHGEIVVKVVDRETQEVIRQIPSEEMLTLSRNIEEVNSLLFDKIKA